MELNREKRSLRLAPDVIMRLITDQAGSLPKALCEAVMNAFDALSEEVRIFIEPNQIVIEDDGIGFQSREEVDHWFAVLGGSAGLKQHRTFGEHGLGRAQLWAYGRNVWHTGEFILGVDVPARGFDYEFDIPSARRQGTRIEVTLFTPLAPIALQEVVDGVGNLCAFVSGRVIVNGRQVSTDPSSRSWTSETPRYWLERSKNRGPLTIYNQGVFVASLHGRVSGTLCTKPGQALSLNIARNQILDDCRLWKAIRAEIGFDGTPVQAIPEVNEARRELLKTARVLGSVLLGWRRVDLFAWDVPAFEDVDGVQFSPRGLLTQPLPVLMRNLAGTELEVSRGLHRDKRALALNQVVFKAAMGSNSAPLVAELLRRARADGVDVVAPIVTGALGDHFPDVGETIGEVKLAAAQQASFGAFVDGFRLACNGLPPELRPAFKRVMLRPGAMTKLAHAASAELLYIDPRRVAAAFADPMSLYQLLPEAVETWLASVGQDDEVMRQVELSSAMGEAVAFSVLRRTELARDSGVAIPVKSVKFVADLIGT